MMFVWVGSVCLGIVLFIALREKWEDRSTRRRIALYVALDHAGLAERVLEAEPASLVECERILALGTWKPER